MPQNDSPDRGYSRRRFLALAGLLPAAGALMPSLLRAAEGAAATPRLGPSKIPLGIELYAVRHELTKDLNGTLKQVADIGYKVVEFYAPYFQWTAAKAREVRQTLDGLGLRCLSTHNHMEAFRGDGLAKAIELSGILGVRQVVLASPPYSIGTADEVKAMCEELTVASAAFQRHGLSAGYHNHGPEWKVLAGGQRGMDIIAANTPKEFVLQLDIGTCLAAGADPVPWIKSHPGRIRSIHLKDWTAKASTVEEGYKVLFGEGDARWAEICAAAETVGGVEIYLMEQEGSRFSEMETAKRCFESWQKLRA